MISCKEALGEIYTKESTSITVSEQYYGTDTGIFVGYYANYNGVSVCIDPEDPNIKPDMVQPDLTELENHITEYASKYSDDSWLS